MNNQEKMKKIYDAVINGKELTTKELNSYGFSSYDLTKMVKDQTLERVKRGVYKLKDVDGLYKYGMDLQGRRELKKARKCFEKCLELSPTCGKACFQLFYRALQDHNLELNNEPAFNYLQRLREIPCDNEQYIRNYNLYLYLFSCIYGVPQKYQDMVFNITCDDVRDDNSEELNEVRKEIMKNRFFKAEQLLLEYSQKNKLHLSELVILYLVKQAKKEEVFEQRRENHNQYIGRLVKKRKYKEIKEYFDRKPEYLSIARYKWIYTLVNDYFEMLDKKVAPVSTVENVHTFNLAIEGKNYPLALELSKQYADSHDCAYEEHEFVILLEDICRLTDSLPKQANGNSKDNVYVSKEREEELRRIIKEKHKTVLREKGMVLLDAMPKPERNTVRRIVKEQYPDMHARGIGVGKEKMMMLRYKTSEELDMQDLEKRREKTFKERRFSECLGIAFEMLSCKGTEWRTTDSSHIYATIGIIFSAYAESYPENGNKYRQKAIKYLTAATELSKEGNGRFDFTDRILQLKEKNIEDIGDRKPLVKMNKNEFLSENSEAEVSSIDGLVSIMHLLGYDVDTVCMGLGISKNKTDIIKLELAKRSYMQGDIELGDMYYKQVEKSKEKNNSTKELLDEIQTDKRFYPNRNTEENGELVKKLRQTWVYTQKKR